MGRPFILQWVKTRRSKKTTKRCCGLKISQYISDQFNLHLHLAAHRSLESQEISSAIPNFALRTLLAIFSFQTKSGTKTMEILDLKNRLNIFFKKEQIEVFFSQQLDKFKNFQFKRKEAKFQKASSSNRKLMLLGRDGKQRNNKSHPTLTPTPPPHQRNTVIPSSVGFREKQGCRSQFLSAYEQIQLLLLGSNPTSRQLASNEDITN